MRITITIDYRGGGTIALLARGFPNNAYFPVDDSMLKIHRTGQGCIDVDLIDPPVPRQTKGSDAIFPSSELIFEEIRKTKRRRGLNVPEGLTLARKLNDEGRTPKLVCFGQQVDNGYQKSYLCIVRGSPLLLPVVRVWGGESWKIPVTVDPDPLRTQEDVP
jgi:hypothetical protein